MGPYRNPLARDRSAATAIMNIAPLLRLASLSALWISLMPAAHAGRPLTVDDANVNDVGSGHVEAWSARLGDRSRAWTVSPAYGLFDGVEIAGAFTRDTTNKLTATALQGKFLFTKPQKDGCNLGAVVGVSHENKGGGNTPYVNGLFTCNGDVGALHLNLGALRGKGGPTLGTWGLAFEREVAEDVTLHVETFGQRHSKPALQFGARTMLTKSVQLDGTVGRQDRNTIYSLGLKVLF